MKIKQSVTVVGIVGVATVVGFIVGVWQMHKIWKKQFEEFNDWRRNQ